MKKILLTAFLILFTSSLTLIAQDNPSKDWQYQPYPKLPFLIEHLELDIHLQPDASVIQGAGRFEIISRQPDVTHLVFDTSDLEIQEISMQGNELDFLVQNDSLIINLGDTLTTGEQIDILILWESNSHYGIHKDYAGNIWTSLNPGASRHWIPLPDHPEVSATVSANFTLPAEMQVVFNGRTTGDDVISTEEKTVHWVSDMEIPLTGMTLAAGNFVRETARSGVKEVAVYAPENELNNETQSELLSQAVRDLKKSENTFKLEFPFEALNVVVLPDHFWEEVQSGAGIIYLYQNLGSLSAQLKRGIAAQWLGNYHTYLDEPDSRYEFLRVAVVNSETEMLKNPDSLQSISYWNTWSGKLDEFENQFLLETVQQSWNGLIQQTKGATSWNDYASFWYDKTGTFWETVTPPQTKEISGNSHLYTVTYQYDEMNNDLSLVFEAQNNPVETLIGIEAEAFGFFDTTRSSYSVTGQLDTIHVDIPESIEYLVLRPENLDEVKLVEYKPSMFLIRQLNSTDLHVKKQAAIQLRSNLDNPDLQLALNDALREEQHPEVRTEILQTLAMITDGATGTEQTFLQMLNTGNEEVQIAGLRALENYPNNEQVLYAVQGKLLQTKADSVFITALSTFNKIADLESRISIITRLEQMENFSERALKAMQAAADADTTGTVIQKADAYISSKEFPYEVRKQALEILLQHQNDQAYWVTTMSTLQEDSDPRLRFHALKGLEYLPEQERNSLLENRLKEEYDPRVWNNLHKKMEK